MVNKKALNKIETKVDGLNAERFGSLLKTVANVPKEKVKALEEQRKKDKDKRAKA